MTKPDHSPNLPSPLVPPDCDNRDLPYIPIEHVRLDGFRFNAHATAEEWRAGVTFWLKSFVQVPSGSLPDDDIELARLSGYGRDLKGFSEVRAMALHGYIKCSDSRLYHPVVCEKALEAWCQKLAQRKASTAGNAKRYGQLFDPDPFDRRIHEALYMLRALNPNSRTLTAFSRRYNFQGYVMAPNELPLGDHRDPVRNPEVTPVRSQYKQSKSKGIEEPESLILKPLPQISPIVQSSERRKMACRIPENWQPTNDDRIFAETLGLNPEHIAAAFNDYWRAAGGNNSRKVDWSAAWRFWCRREAEGRRGHVLRQAVSGTAASREGAIAANQQRIRELEQKYSPNFSPPSDFFDGQTIEGEAS